MPVKPIPIRSLCVANHITAHGFTGQALAVRLKKDTTPYDTKKKTDYNWTSNNDCNNNNNGTIWHFKKIIWT